jgi:hypothetical protein
MKKTKKKKRPDQADAAGPEMPGGFYPYSPCSLPNRATV